MKAKLPFVDGGIYKIAFNMSVDKLVDRHVGRYVGKWVSPKTAIYSWEFGARHFSHTENCTVDALNFIQGIFKEDLLFRRAKN